MKRGEIRWYSFKPPDKRRPVLILGELLTTLSDDKMAAADAAICFALGIEVYQ